MRAQEGPPRAVSGFWAVEYEGNADCYLTGNVGLPPVLEVEKFVQVSGRRNLQGATFQRLTELHCRHELSRSPRCNAL